MNLTAVEGCVFCKELAASSMWKYHCSNVKNLVIILRFLPLGFRCFHMEPDLCKKDSAYCVYTLLASLDLPLSLLLPAVSPHVERGCQDSLGRKWDDSVQKCSY